MSEDGTDVRTGLGVGGPLLLNSIVISFVKLAVDNGDGQSY